MQIKGWRMKLCLILQPFVALPTSQLILQPFPRFTYVTDHSPTLPLLHLRHRHFTYVTWRVAHGHDEYVALIQIHGLGHKSWQLFYFVDICERITNVYVSCGMSAGIVSTHSVLSSVYVTFSHRTGIVETKNSCHDFCPNLRI